MKSIDLFRNKYKLETADVNGEKINYRYYRNKESDKTIVLLTGGIGLSDLFYMHFEKFAEYFSVITFDYPIGCKSARDTAEKIAEFLKSLNIKAYLVGHSLGGMIGQIIAKYHPEIVQGLIFSNTGSLAKDINEEGRKCQIDMIDRQRNLLEPIKTAPFELVKKSMRDGVTKKTDNLSEQDKDILDEWCDVMDEELTKEYELYMINLLVDMENNMNMVADDFKYLNGNVLLIMSEDDNTFNNGVKSSLIKLMGSPKTVTNFTGGHLAMIFKAEQYVQIIREFIENN